MNGRQRLRVIKVGGSLFRLDNLADRLTGWLDQQPPACDVLVSGGGQLADVIREADRRFGLGEEASHQLCLSALDVAAQLLAELLPQVVETASIDELSQRRKAKRYILRPAEFFRDREPHWDDHPLPHTWATTTDSIAARLAEILRADELVLLKSADPPTRRHLANYVDASFTTASSQVTNVRMVNLLRSPA